VSAVLKYAVLVAATAVMIVGMLVTAGVLVPRYIPDQFRVISGIVVFLYGLYRFVITWIGRQRREL
jgi:hypothetical protein